MATDADRAFLDTNVLLAATDEDRADHRAATRVLNDSSALGVTLYLSGQILREYLVVASRPMDRNGLGLPMSSALANVDAFLGRTTVVEETLAVAARLRSLLAATACSGRQVHDANVVATMVVHGIGTLITENISDFRRFAGVVTIRPLAQA